MQVYSAFEQFVYSPSSDFAQLLAMQLVRPFDFRAAMSVLQSAGCEHLVECGADETLASILRRNVPRESAVHLTVLPDQNLSAALTATATALGTPATARTAATVPMADVSADAFDQT